MPPVLTIADVNIVDLQAMLSRYSLQLEIAADGAEIPGSYWGVPEAGLIGDRVHVRSDTPVHSLLHEACHAICMSAERRAALHRDAGGDDLEEAAVCFLQLKLADHVPGVGRDRLMQDMDSWGYSFRLGSTRAWFEDDATDASRWLVGAAILDAIGEVTFELRS